MLKSTDKKDLVEPLMSWYIVLLLEIVVALAHWNEGPSLLWEWERTALLWSRCTVSPFQSPSSVASIESSSATCAETCNSARKKTCFATSWETGCYASTHCTPRHTDWALTCGTTWGSTNNTTWTHRHNTRNLAWTEQRNDSKGRRNDQKIL